MTKIEEVARAIYAANCWWRAVEADDDGLGRYKDGHGSDRFRAIEWEQLPEDDRKEHLDSARAAIEAIREPNEAMTSAGALSICGVFGHCLDEFAANAHRAMIDAILSDGEA